MRELKYWMCLFRNNSHWKVSHYCLSKAFKYLGHIGLYYRYSVSLSDDDYVQCKIRSLFTRVNIFARRFGK